MDIYYFDKDTKKVVTFSCNKIIVGTDHMLATNTSKNEEREIQIFLVLYIEA